MNSHKIMLILFQTTVKVIIDIHLIASSLIYNWVYENLKVYHISRVCEMAISNLTRQLSEEAIKLDKVSWVGGFSLRKCSYSGLKCSSLALQVYYVTQVDNLE